MDITFYPAHALKKLYAEKKTTPAEIYKVFREKIERLNPRINAYLSLLEEQPVKTGPLSGIPVAISESIAYEGTPMTLGSHLLKDEIAQKDDYELTLLKDAGAMILGKTNFAEFGLSTYTENNLEDYCRNPWNILYHSGGSEGGAVAAVAAGMATSSVALDLFGDVRIPAGLCGALALKTTRGRVPFLRDYNLPVVIKLLQQHAFVTRDAKDAALLCDIVMHEDPRDSWSVSREEHSFLPENIEKKEPLKICWSSDLGYVPENPEVMAALKKTVDNLKALGHSVEEVSMGITEDVLMHTANLLATDFYIPIVTILSAKGASSSSLTKSVERWLDLGKEVSGLSYSVALAYIDWIYDHVNNLLKDYDVLITPTSPVPSVREHVDILHPLLGMAAFTVPFNMSGNPSLNVPAAISEEGLPIGVQMVGNYFQEEKLLALAYQLEQKMPWKNPELT